MSYCEDCGHDCPGDCTPGVCRCCPDLDLDVTEDPELVNE